MKPCLNLILLLATFALQAQIRMEVQGDFQLFGRMNITSQGPDNVFAGQAAGVSTTTGGRNVFMGIRAGFLNVSGGANTFMGYEAGRNNLSGNQNTAMGHFALSNNQLSSKNIAIGSRALLSLEDGYGIDPAAGNTDLGTTYNLAIGTNAGQITNDFSRNGAERNTFVGNNCATINTTGYRNAFFGFQAGDNNQTGNYNTFIGHEAGIGNTSGSFNTLVGHQSTVSSGNLTNSAAFGSNASVNASNKIRIGDAFVTTVEGQGWSLPSDGRFKTDVRENVPGLDFIMALRPVTYRFDAQKYHAHIQPEKSRERTDDPKQNEKEAYYRQVSASIQTGLIAQEVEAAAEKQGFDFNGVIKPTNPQDNYGISYSLLVVPVIRGMQEQQAQIEALREENESLKAANDELRDRMARLEAMVGQSGAHASPDGKVSLSDARLLQNRPNPFSERTIISYYVPETVQEAFLEVIGMDGRLLKRIPIGIGMEGSTELEAGTLAAGNYIYRLWLDGRVVDARQMVLTK